MTYPLLCRSRCIIYLGAAILAVQATENPDNASSHTNFTETDSITRDGRTKQYIIDELDDRFNTFHTFQSVLNFLQQPEHRHQSRVKELLHIYMVMKIRFLKVITDNANLSAHPFIVIAGSPSAGSDKIGAQFGAVLSCLYIFSPPNYLFRFRLWYRKANEGLRKAFNAIVVYLMSYQIMAVRKQEPVIMTRYWDHHTAYTLANYFVDYGDFPGVNSTMFQWPEDLLKPDAIYFLKGSLSNASEKFQLFDSKVLEFYRALKDPQVTIIQKKTGPRTAEKLYAQIMFDIRNKFNLSVQKQLRCHIRLNPKTTI